MQIIILTLVCGFIEFALGVALGLIWHKLKWLTLPARKASRKPESKLRATRVDLAPARPAPAMVTHRVARSRIITHADTAEFDRLQIEQAASGCISGTLGEWPSLCAALRRHGEFWPAGTPARMIRRACIELLARIGHRPNYGNYRVLHLPEVRQQSNF